MKVFSPHQSQVTWFTFSSGFSAITISFVIPITLLINSVYIHKQKRSSGHLSNISSTKDKMPVELGHLPVPRGDWANWVWHVAGAPNAQSSEKQFVEGIKRPAETSDGGETLLADVQYGYTNKLP